MAILSFRWFRWICSLTLLVMGPSTQAQNRPSELVLTERFPRIIHVDLGENRMVNGSLYDDIAKELQRAEGRGPVAVVLKIDSGGGEVPAAQDIVALIRSYRESDQVRVFAWVPRFAYSAAAWIALACRGLFIAPDATIGNLQPLVQSFRGYELAPGKIVSSLAEEVVVTCQDNGVQPRYPRLFLLAMVDRDIEIVELHDVSRPEAPPIYMRATDFRARPAKERARYEPNYIGTPEKALTTNGQRLIDFGFPVRLVKMEEQIRDIIGTPDVEIEERDLSGPSALGFHIDWSVILLVAAFILLALEFKTAGVGVFGVMGVLAMILFFLVQADWEQSAMLPIAIFLLGAFLLLVEAIILPGFTIPGVLGILMILYATWVGLVHPEAHTLPPWPDFDDKTEVRGIRDWGLTILGSLAVGMGVAISLGKVLHRIPFFSRMVLIPSMALRMKQRTAESAETAGGPMRAADGTRATVVVGARGIAHTPLRPAGVALIADHKIDVVTPGMWVEKGTPVEVVEISGLRVVVEPIDHSNEVRDA
ncbi:MAG TPA: hypothetical protein ENK43_02120 [Planctomycetes bacterium]|nr:hypothetical protein [Planctomycetota bacterium]